MIKKTVLYICDPSRAISCNHAGCQLGMCKCTSHPEWAALDKNGRPIATIIIEKEEQEEEDL